MFKYRHTKYFLKILSDGWRKCDSESYKIRKHYYRFTDISPFNNLRDKNDLT